MNKLSIKNLRAMHWMKVSLHKYFKHSRQEWNMEEHVLVSEKKRPIFTFPTDMNIKGLPYYTPKMYTGSLQILFFINFKNTLQQIIINLWFR